MRLRGRFTCYNPATQRPGSPVGGRLAAWVQTRRGHPKGCDCGVDLFDTLGLLAGGGSDVSDQGVGGGHLLGDLRERLLDFGGALGTFSAVGDRYRNQKRAA
jgi:hypothetical protein